MDETEAIDRVAQYRALAAESRARAASYRYQAEEEVSELLRARLLGLADYEDDQAAAWEKAAKDTR